MAGNVVVGVAKQSPRLRPRASEGRALVKVKKEPGTAEAVEGSVDTKGKLSNLVAQGKAAANKLAKVVAGQTANPEELEASLPRGATDKRMDMLASWKSDRGRVWASKEKVLEKESASARLELSAAFVLA